MRSEKNEMLQLSVSDLKRAGLLRPGEYTEGGFYWRRDGREFASMYVASDLRYSFPSVRFVYVYNGPGGVREMDCLTFLQFRPSGRGLGGFYVFVCPVSHQPCRKLYLRGGKFVSRHALQ